MTGTRFSFANALTILRILLIPFIIIFLFIPTIWAAWTALFFYIIAGLTDFFDGFFARKFSEVSSFGKFLDPVADKLLVASLLLALVATGRIDGGAFLPALIILMREFLISGLREYLADLGEVMPVSNLAKWKTTAQILCLGFLIMAGYSPDWIPSYLIGLILIWIAAVLTVMTGASYVKLSLKHLLRE